MIKRLHARLPVHDGVFVPPITCADGFTMSVQASQLHYCTPRADGGWHTHFEVGFPTEREELLMPYAEEPHAPTRTVYGWVPAEVIDQVIEKHGGVSKEFLQHPKESNHEEA